MKKQLVIFGSGDLAELAYYYFSNDTDYEVVAFTLDSKYIEVDKKFGLKVVPFETISETYPPSQYSLFIALSYSNLNEVRKEKYEAAKEKGYSTPSYISSKATVLNDFNIGENCFILENNTIQPFVDIGNNVTLWSGNHIGHHSSISDHTFISSHVVVSGGVSIGKQCFLGVNATLRDHISLGDKSVVGAGVLLLKSCEQESLFIGSGASPSNRKSSSIKRI